MRHCNLLWNIYKLDRLGRKRVSALEEKRLYETFWDMYFNQVIDIADLKVCKTLAEKIMRVLLVSSLDGGVSALMPTHTGVGLFM